MPFMTKDLSKKILAKARLRNNYLIDKQTRIVSSILPRNKCLAILMSNKKIYNENLDKKDVTYNKKFRRL